MKKDIPIKEKSLKVRFLSALTSIMVLMMTVVPTLNVSATDVNSLDGSSTTTDVKLLVGDGSPLANGAENAKDVIANADATYLLGIASQFCVFLQNDFTVKDADSEGRVAIGGVFSFDGEWDYHIGQGDFETGISIEKLTNINGESIYNKGAAHFIMGGDHFERVNAKSDYTGDEKIFAVGENFDIDKCTYKHVPYNENYIYKSDLINFDEEFGKLKATSSNIASVSTNGIIEWDGTTLNLTCTDQSADVVYFNVSDWTDGAIEYINYIDIPDGAYIVVTCNDNNISIFNDNQYYINEYQKYVELNAIVTSINGEEISTVQSNSFNDGATPQNNNNNVNSERILYNFPNASKIDINANFNGTILAPNADVTSSDECKGHLSGALIAQSFSGGLEFGYRPYQGTVNMLKVTDLSYSLPIQKLDINGDGLAGATLGLYDEENNLVSSIVSTGDIDCISVPTQIDFSGNTDYSSMIGDYIDNIYYVQEISAPKGYEKTNLAFSVDVTEGILAVDNNGIPTETSVFFDIESSDYSYFDMFVLSSILNTYDANGNITNRRININDGSYIFDIGFKEDGTVSSITDTNSSMSLDIADVSKSGTFIYDDEIFYYDADNTLIMSYLEPFTFVNEEVGATIKLEKVDQNGDNLSGAIVDIYDENDNKIASNVSLDMTNGNLVDIGNVVDTNYATSSGALKPGIYYLVETTAPENAEIVTDKQYFKVNDDASLTVPYELSVEMPTAYNINQMAFSDDGSANLDISKITLYYLDGTNSNVSTQINGSNYWYPFDLNSVSKENIIGIEFIATGTGSRNLVIQDNSYQNIGALCGTVSTGTTLFGTDTVPTIEELKNVISLTDDIIKFKNEVTQEEEKTFDVTISKVDATNGGIELEGATLTVTSNDGIDLSEVTSNNDTLTISEDKTSVTFISQTTDTILSNLPAGEYTLSETTAPNGYTKAESITFVVNEDGTTSIDRNDVEKVVMEDNQIVVNISKTDIANDTELAGAIIQVISKDNLDLSNVTSSNNNISLSENKSVIEFTSLDEATILEKLPAGDYTLVETSAPDGYTINKISVEFTVNQDGSVTGSTIIQDDVITVTINKVEISGGNELKDAILTIEKLTGNIGDVQIVGKDAESIQFTKTENSITYVTDGETSTTFSHLTTGIYKLTEKSAPDGYEIADDIYFRIDEEGNIFVGETQDELSKVDNKTIIMIDEKSTEETTTTTEETTIEDTTTSETTTSETTTTVPSETTTIETTTTVPSETTTIETTTTVPSETTTIETTTTVPSETTTIETTTTVPSETTTTETTTTVSSETTTTETTTTVPSETTTTETTTTVPSETTTTETTTTVPSETTTTETTTTVSSETTTMETTTTVPSETTTETTTTVSSETTTMETTTTVPSETTTETTTTVPSETTTETTTTVPSETTTETTTTVPSETTTETTTTVPSETTTETTTTVPSETTTTETTTTVPSETTTMETTTTVTSETTTETTTTVTSETTTSEITTIVTTDEEFEDTTIETTLKTDTSETDTTTTTTSSITTTVTTTNTSMTTTSIKKTSSPSTSDSGFGMALAGITVAISLMFITIKKDND